MTRNTFEAKSSSRFSWKASAGYESHYVDFNEGVLSAEAGGPGYFNMDSASTRQLYEAMKNYYEEYSR